MTDPRWFQSYFNCPKIQDDHYHYYLQKYPQMWHGIYNMLHARPHVTASRRGVINMIASVKPPPREPGRRPQTEQYHCMTACGRVELPCCIIPPQNWPSSPLSPVSLMFNSAISSWSDLNVGYMLNFNTPLTIKRWCVRYFGYFRIIVWINAIKSRRN